MSVLRTFSFDTKVETSIWWLVEVFDWFKGPFTPSLAIAIPKSDSLAIAMLAKEMAYPTHSLVKSLVKICLFPAWHSYRKESLFGIAITKDFAKASVNGNLCITNVLMVNIR